MKKGKQIAIEVLDEFHRELKIRASKRNISMKEFVIDAIKIKNILTKEDGLPKKKITKEDFKKILEIYKKN